MRTIAFTLSLVFILIIPWEGVELPHVGAIAQFVGFGLTAFWLGTVALTGQLRKPGPFQVAFFCFVAWNALTVFWSANPNRTLAHVLTWTQLCVFAFILWDLYTTRTAIAAGLQAYVLGAYVAVGSAIANYLSGAAYYTNYDRFSAGDTNPDGFGFILVLGIPLAWRLATLQNSGRVSALLKVLNYIYIPAALLGISLSGTRTALIATIPAMAFGLASLTRVRLGVRIAIFLFLTGAILLALPYLQTLPSFQRFSTTASELTEGDLNDRANIWQEGLASFAKHPLTGIGSNMYRSINSLGKVAHNSFISVLVESGLIGFALFAICLTIALLQVWRQPTWERRFWLALLAVWFIGSFTLTWEHRKSTWLFLTLLVASAALIEQREEDEAFDTDAKSVALVVQHA